VLADAGGTTHEDMLQCPPCMDVALACDMVSFPLNCKYELWNRQSKCKQVNRVLGRQLGAPDLVLPPPTPPFKVQTAECADGLAYNSHIGKDG